MSTPRSFYTAVTVGLALGCALAASRPAAAPLLVDAMEDISNEFPGTPKLHSFAWAQWDGNWIFIGGRTGGYHGVGQGDVDFPRARANQRIWVIQPPTSGTAKVYSFAVADMPRSLASVEDQWVSSNLLHFQDKDTLYLAGGYGENSTGELVTYPVISSVNLPALVDGVIRGKDTFSKTIAWAESPLVQSTGGGLLKLDDGLFYLVGGHIFMGSYRSFEGADEKSTPKASQKYLGEIRKLRLAKVGQGRLDVRLVESFSDPEFARRDLNVGLTIQNDGRSLGASAYGGVFTQDQLNFTHPIFFSAGLVPKVDKNFEQKMSAYSCATMQLYDPDSFGMYTTFFGGISRWRWSDSGGQFVAAPVTGDKTRRTGYLDGMPWINEITTLVQNGSTTFEFVQKNRLPGYLGTNAAFLAADGLKQVREDADIFDLRQFRGKRVLAGYLFGGIRAFPKQFPYTDDAPDYTSGTVPAKASDLILKIYVTAP